MKNRSKLILAASALLVLSGTAVGTGTYAWYSANRSASLTVNTIGAQNQSTSMDVSFDDTADGTTLTKKGTADEGDNFTLTAANSMTDVTGNGSGDFAKPMFDATADRETTNVVGWWADQTTYTSTTGYKGSTWYQKFTLKFTITGGSDGAKTAVYLNPDSTIAKANEADELDVTKSIRYSAVIGSDVALYANPAGSVASEASYWKKPETGVKPTATAVEATNKVGTDGFFGVANKLAEGDVTSGTNGTYDDNGKGFLFDSAVGTVSVTFYVWDEGSDADCVNTATAATSAGFKLDLKFYSLQEALMTAAA